MKIIVADDADEIRLFVSRYLAESGHTIIEARNGDEAYELLLQDDIRFLITDWMMPGMNGIELIQKVRQTITDRYVYIILLTARTEKKEIVKGINAGADDFLGKPFHPAELRARLRAGERLLTLEQDLEEQNIKLKQAYDTITKDLHTAAALQSELLPPSGLKIGGMSFANLFLPSTILAGDIFNYYPLDSTKTAFYLVDVAGHGVPAAMTAFTLSKLLIPSAGHLPGYPEAPYDRPAAMLTWLNNRFEKALEAMQYFTVIYGILYPETGKVCLSNGGHPLPLLLGADGQVRQMGRPGMAVGMFPGTTYTEEVFSLSAGDHLVTFSDGATECMNLTGEMFGMERVAGSLAAANNGTVDEQLTALRAALVAWRGGDAFEDDVTAISISMAY